MYDIVVIYVVNLNAVIVESGTVYLVACGVNCHVAVVTLALVGYHSVTLYDLGVSEHLGLLVFKNAGVVGIVAFLQLDKVRIGVLKPKYILNKKI